MFSRVVIPSASGSNDLGEFQMLQISNSYRLVESLGKQESNVFPALKRCAGACSKEGLVTKIASINGFHLFQ